MKKFLFILKRVAQLILIIAVVGVFIFTLMSSVDKAKNRVCSSIQVDIDFPSSFQLINEAEILSLTNAVLGREIVGKPLISLNLKKIEQALKKNVYVDNAEVYVDQHQLLHIDVRQRVPFLRVINNDGVSYYLTESHIKMPLHDNFTVNVPIAIGYVKTFDDNMIDSITQQKLVELVKIIERDSFLSSMIDHIEVLENKKIRLHPRVTDHVISLGEVDVTTSKRLDNLKHFYAKVMAKGNWDKYQMINIEMAGQIVGTKRDSI